MVANLRRIRKERGMTQSELAAASGIHRITISKYEAGKVTPNVDSAKSLAEALGVTVDELINGKKEA